MSLVQKKKQILSLIFAVVLVIFSPLVSAQTSQLQQAQEDKAQLQLQLEDIERQINIYQQQLNGIKGEKNTLQNKIKQLQKQQSTLNLQIQATNLKIADLEKQLAETQVSISQKLTKSQELKEQLANSIRLINERDNFPFLYTVVAQDNISGAATEIENYSKISENLKNLLSETIEIKNQLDLQAIDLERQQEEAKNLIAIKKLQQQELVGTVSAQSALLQETKGKESEYQAALSDSQKRGAEIRNRLYETLGVNKQVTFGEAVQIAQWASSATGVRAAFLLAILTQESNLGKNVGTCNRPGDGPEKSWKVVMKPDRDQQPFLQITAELGMDPDITPVSCPMKDSKGKQLGWGGAMGPAQFIPSTWMGYKDKVAAITGKMANPWDIRDAFMASAIKLKAGGAGTVEGEWAAAMRYFSGGTNVKYRFYGDNVVATANKYQSDIDELNR